MADASTDARTFRVRILAWGHRFLGDIQVFARDGEVSLRSVQGGRCDEVMEALAFIVTVSIDPNAAGTPPPPPSPPDPPTPVASPPAPKPDPSPSPPPPGDVTFSAPSDDAGGAPAERPSTPAPAAPSRRPWHASLGVGAFAEGLAAPGAVAGDLLFFGVAWDRPGAWSPELRLAVARASSSTLSAAPGHAELEWTFARAETCPIRWVAYERFEVRPCVRGDAGALAASASGVPNSQSRVRPWAVLGGTARIEWLPFEPLRVSLEGGLAIPLVREQFFIAPTPVVYQAPSIAADGTLALGVRFW
jgi:hypothetical protein